MTGWRDKKRAALNAVHAEFEVPAVYLTKPTGTPAALTVRIHRKPVQERLPYADFGDSAAMLDMHDRVIFKKSDLPVVPEGVLSKAYVIVGPTEAYLTGPSKPEREGYFWVEVSEVAQADLTALIAQLDLNDPAYLGILT